MVTLPSLAAYAHSRRQFASVGLPVSAVELNLTTNAITNRVTPARDNCPPPAASCRCNAAARPRAKDTGYCTWSLSRDLEWAAASELRRDAHDCIRLRSLRIDRIQVCGANSALNGELPSDHPLPLQASA